MYKLMAEQLTKIKSQIMKTSDIVIGLLGTRLNHKKWNENNFDGY